MEIILLEDELSFAIIELDPKGYNEQCINLREQYGAKPNASAKSKGQKTLAMQMALMGWVEQHVVDQHEAVQYARQLEPNCNVSHSGTLHYVEIVVTFTERDTAALFKLTWAGRN